MSDVHELAILRREYDLNAKRNHLFDGYLRNAPHPPLGVSIIEILKPPRQQ
jgi:hypothetical protein